MMSKSDNSDKVLTSLLEPLEESLTISREETSTFRDLRVLFLMKLTKCLNSVSKRM